jgi:hypothetical protein
MQYSSTRFLHDFVIQYYLFILKIKLSRRAVPKVKVDPGLQCILSRFPISQNAQRSSGAKLYTVLYYYIFLILEQTA